MKTREDVIRYCLTFEDVYEDYPFHEGVWATIRHKGNKRVFAWIFEKDGQQCVNVKCDPEWIEFWRNAFSGVRPGFHMNKKYWNTILLDGSVPEHEVKRMIGDSYDITKNGKGGIHDGKKGTTAKSTS